MSLIPNYLTTDFNTLKADFITQLQNSDEFKDYNFEGANITVLIELLAYIGELNTYYMNKIAQNVYIDTADVFENVHRISTMLGYNPKGYLAPTATLKATITQETSGEYFSPGDQLYVPVWSEFETEENVKFLTTTSYAGTVSTSATSASDLLTYEFDLPVKQGTHEVLEYKGIDLVDNKLILPTFTFDHSKNDEDTGNIAIILSINENVWTRLDDFFEDISGLSYPSLTNDVYKFSYDKYNRYIIEFSEMRNVPADSDEIVIDVIITDGEDGAIGANTLTQFNSSFITNTSTSTPIPTDNIEITNTSTSTTGGNPEIISEIKSAAKGEIHSQKRNVTSRDYISFLEERDDIIKANVWGEKDINRQGDTRQYNKIHISAVPNAWNTQTISTSGQEWEPFPNRIGEIQIPYEYNDTWEETLKKYLEPRKILTVYEQFDLPDLVYFAFQLGIRTKRLYNFNDVSNAIRNKLDYYFKSINRSFGEEVSFMDIHNYILDPTEVSESDSFENIKGIDNLVFRDIVLNKTVYDYNKDYNYPMYTREDFESTVENKLKNIQLGPNMFPTTLTLFNIIEEEI